ARKSAEDAQAAMERLRDRKKYGEDETAPILKAVDDAKVALEEARQNLGDWDPYSGERFGERALRDAEANLSKLESNLAEAKHLMKEGIQSSATGSTDILRDQFNGWVQSFRDQLDPLGAALKELEKKAEAVNLPKESADYQEAERLIRERYAKKSDKPDATSSQVGESLVTKARQAIADGVQYKFKARDMATGKIDCSGFVEQINRETIAGIEKESKGALPAGLAQALSGSSEGIIDKVSKLTGELVEVQANRLDLSKMREGMLVGLDTGPTKSGFDAGRQRGIDHIVQFVKDADGALKVIQSSVSGGGVSEMDAAEWVRQFKDKVRAYVVDPYKNLRLPWETLGNYAKQVNEVEDILTRS
ncbi:hypothetical protein, partial [Megalodesulfovibrio gigas]|uniref:hypothetical protein n=1 Tax=Megalodesulfovibrio gigas TaxID=879 RepID=UPI000556025A